MMRLLFLSLLLLLPAASASDDTEGSASFESDDEDMPTMKTHGGVVGSFPKRDQSTGSTEDSKEGQVLVIAIVAVVAVLVLTIVIVAVVCVRRRKLNQEQGIYTVPTEQGHKIAI
ncbi:uncharacterized protein LOC101173652 [Oryzias latipes]|uniref:uncharacterized protein LOC101173652 n=1 Tax=Oryzias latipes TaxID=8090 RepID=UPI0002A49323|nr:uncharacterized protein LOC101173652 [Oryzias latipes]XP_011483419.1 uncharacterized protein LOC101173652 [Oryzias latipes]XP_011483420.1 uncharacterized protein LOC101173652 [Oryzias latipes]XP_020565759.1 uncharacterized protein LOC101173652 [Oryzias latipes]